MGKLRACLLFYVVVLVLSLSSNASGQASTGANTDIVKMLQAGLPESTIINKIREGARRWDTSVDALIALKQAGATEAELAALTTAPVQTESVIKADSVAAPEAQIEVFGASLFRTGDGDPYLHFYSSKSEVFPDGLESNSAYLILYKGEVGILIAGSSLTLDCHPLNAIFLKDRLVLDRYLDSGCMYRATLAAKYRGPNAGPEEFAKEGLSLKTGKKYGALDGSSVGFKAPFTLVQFSAGKKVVMKDRLAFGIFPYNSTKTYEFINTELMYAPLLDPFIEGLMSNFDQTVLDIERAAKITDPLTQLSAHAHYEPITAAKASKYMAILQQRHDEESAASNNSGGNGWLTALSALQGVTNLQQAMAQAKAADSSRSGVVSGALVTPPKQPSGFTYNISHGQAENKTAAANTVVAPTPSAQVKTTPKPTAVLSSGSTGIAPPANCVAPNVEGPCIPLAQYQQMQAQKQSSAQGICPASGFVPGVMIRKESDVAVGVPCKPGTPYGPLIATTSTGGYTGVTPPDAAPAGGSGGRNGSGNGSGSGSGGAGAGAGSVTGLSGCIQISYKTDPITGTHLILTNNCSVAADVYFYSSAQVNGEQTINPGGIDNTYAAQDKIAAAGGVSVYACPVNYVPRKADRTFAYTGQNNPYSCSPK